MSGSKMLAAKPLLLITSRASINLAHLANLDTKPTPQIHVCANEPFVLCGRSHYPAEGRISRLSIRGATVLSEVACVNKHPHGWQDPGSPGLHCPKPLPAYLPPQCILSPCVLQISDAKGKEDYQTRPHPASNT